MKSKVALLLLATTLTLPLRAQVLPNDVIVEAKTIGEWSAEWWKWVLSTPTNQNALFDADGSRANNAQPDASVFFLAGTFFASGSQEVTRRFTVPEGKYLFFPVWDIYGDNVDTVPPWTVETLRDALASFLPSVSEVHASIDGVAVTNLSDHRAISPVFSIDFTNADNLESFNVGHPVTGLDDPILADGYYLMLEPLSPGVHVVNFGFFSSPGPAGFAINVTDIITIVSLNRPPIADASATRLRVIAATDGDARVVLDASRSSDPDNDVLTYSWLEKDSVLSMAVISTQLLNVGTHVISLVVSDRKLSATNTIQINVITAEKAVRELLLRVHSLSLSRKIIHSLLPPLEHAEKDFQRRHFAQGIHQLTEFQKKVREHVKPVSPLIGNQFIQSAQEIIDAVNTKKHKESPER